MASQVSAEKKETPPPPSASNEAAKQGVFANQPAATTESVPAAGGKVATLDDVVKELNHLNTTMAQLAKITGDTNSLVERQVKATKAIGGNVYDRI